MEDLVEICKMREVAKTDLERMCTKFREQFSQMLRGKMDLGLPRIDSGSSDGITPQQTLKRAKKLSKVNEGDETKDSERLSRRSNSSLLAEADCMEETRTNLHKTTTTTTIHETVINETVTVTTSENEAIPEHSFARPTRQAKLKAEKNLKEPKTNAKMRRPSNFDINSTLTIKKERDVSMASKERMESSIVICDKEPVVVDLLEDSLENDVPPLKELRVIIKREKLSVGSAEVEREKEKEEREKEKEKEKTLTLEVTQTSSVVSHTSELAKKKKKKIHQPIKLESWDELDKKETASANVEQHSQYEDAVDNAPAAQKQVIPAVINDATFCAINDKTITISQQNTNRIDETFDVVAAATAKESNNSLTSSTHSMETAKDSVSHTRGDSLITEDESNHETPKVIKIEKDVEASQKQTKNMSAVKKKDILIPFAESPVKTKIKAFESAALANQAANSRAKENKPLSGTSSNTPSTGKLRSAALGRFLTPTQSSNLTPKSMMMVSQAKKAPSSASKATTLLKTSSAKVKAVSSAPTGSVKALSRENSADEMRKMNEERKKLREQKHLQAAQLREAKERERAERIAKLAKEREEKLQAKKQAEAEQRKQEEIQRKLRAQQEAAEAEQKQKAKLKIAEQERALLKQLKYTAQGATPKPSDLMPPPAVPKSNNKYCFEMLHEDDSTDDEDKVTFKRPPVPTWSRRGKRESAILMQQHFPTAIIDEYFSVAPTTFDLSEVFPNIDKKHLKRNSSAFWSTPPRYSELPKY